MAGLMAIFAIAAELFLLVSLTTVVESLDISGQF